MFNQVSIENYRAFQKLEINDLKRVNLFVGKNNAGKTCLLEAIDLLGTLSPSSLMQTANRRGETIPFETAPNNWQNLPDPRYAFHGRQASIGSSFTIEGRAQGKLTRLKATIAQVQHAIRPDEIPSPLAPELAINFEVNGTSAVIPMGRGGMQHFPFTPFQNSSKQTRFIPIGALNSMAAAQIWGQFAATEEEERIIEALRIVEPGIEKLAISITPFPMLFARLAGEKDRIPLGNLGDGVIRLLVLAGHLSSLEPEGMLLVDEIDDGLHVSTMEQLWDLVLTVAEARNVQVFSTTHSDDCLRGLASALRKRDRNESIALHRIDRIGGDHVTTYNKEEIIYSAEKGIEVR